MRQLRRKRDHTVVRLRRCDGDTRKTDSMKQAFQTRLCIGGRMYIWRQDHAGAMKKIRV